jgi:hypothetical protein
MIVLMGFFDRVLDIIGLMTVIYLSWRGARWYYNRDKNRAAHGGNQ